MHPARVSRERALKCLVWVKDGQAPHMQPVERANVDPYSCYQRCGMFLRQVSCPCSPESGCKCCRFGGTGQHTFSAATETRALGNDTAFAYSLLADDDIYDRLDSDTWRIQRWGGGTLRKFLCMGDTGEDFYHASSLAEGGIYVVSPTYNRTQDYEETGSEFGDADSQRSLQWAKEDARLAYRHNRF